MDLGKFSLRKAADGAAVLHLEDPATGEKLYDGETPVTITVRGMDCTALREKRKDIERRQAEGEEISPEQSGAELLAAVTVGWSGIGLHSDEELPFSFENAVALYLDPDAEWICGQVGPFSRSRRNFVKNRPSG